MARVARLGQPHAAAVTRLWWEPDPELMLAAGLTRQTWGFRKSPVRHAPDGAAAVQHRARAPSSSTTTASSGARTRTSTSWWTRRPRSSRTSTTSASATTARALRPRASGESYYDVELGHLRASPWPRWWAPTRTLEFYAGPDVKLDATPPQSGVSSASDQPYGLGQFGQVGVKGGFDLDTRGHPRTGTARRPVPLRRQARPLGSSPEGGRLQYYPDAWDATESSAASDGIAARLPGRPARHARGDASAAARCGATTPGSRRRSSAAAGTCAGTARTASAGDASLYGSVEARLWLFKGRLIAPGRWGVFGLADIGPRLLRGRVDRTAGTRRTAAGSSSRCSPSTRCSTRRSPTATTAPASTWTMASGF